MCGCVVELTVVAHVSATRKVSRTTRLHWSSDQHTSSPVMAISDSRTRSMSLAQPQQPRLARAASASSSGGSGLLLRLFQSEYFNVHLAIAYLKNYPDSIGITYYLIDRLGHFPETDIEFYWPQLCHLLISRPTESHALESFLIRKCHDSTHLAMKTLWYLQSSLSDLSSTPNTRSFAICRRTFNKVQSIIFSDPLHDLLTLHRQEDPRIAASRTGNGPAVSPNGHKVDPHEAKTPTGYLRQFKKHALVELTKLKGGKISEKILPTTVGMGLVLGGIGFPQMANQMGTVPVEQSRKYEDVLDVYQPVKKHHQTESPDNSASEEEIEAVAPQSRKLKTPAKPTRNLSVSDTKVQHHKSSIPSKDIKGKGKSYTMIESYSASEQAGGLQDNQAHFIDYTPGAPLSHTPMSLSVSDSDSSAATPSSAALTPEPYQNSPFPPRSLWGASRPDSINPVCAPSIATAPLPGTGPFFRRPNVSSTTAEGVNFAQDPLPSSSQAVSNPPIASIPPPRSPQSLIPITIRPRIPSTTSQSVPSLPNTLARSKLEPHLRLNHYESRRPASPLLSLAFDPSLVPSPVLNHVLKSQLMRSQLDLITNLQDISTRLVVVPKIARLSALRAELTVLNHSLPKGCCLGMYCKGEELDSEGRRRAHHRIVRISPNESVVLNSADRAPFLIHVEVLEDHLDFDPQRRSNYEDLRKALAHASLAGPTTRQQHNLSGELMCARPKPIDEHQSKSSARSEIPPRSFSSPSESLASPGAQNEESFRPSSLFPQQPELSSEPEAEEMDLVDQVYGRRVDDGRMSSKAILEQGEELLLSSLHTELPSGMQNRALDEQAWTRVEADKRASGSINGITGSTSQLLNATALTKSTLARAPSKSRKPISLDEYAARMRMAAIMLAQLNASQLPPQPLKSSAAAGMVVGGAIGLGAGFVGVTVGAGLGAVVSRLATSGGQTVIMSPIGRRTNGGVAGQGTSGLMTKLDTTHAASGAVDAPRPSVEDTGLAQTSTSSNTGMPRHKVLTPLQSKAIKDKIMAEMMALEEERVERMKQDRRRGVFGFEAGQAAADEAVVMKAVGEDDPSGSMLGESWTSKRERIRAASPYGHLSNWNVFSVIVKTGADLRQEQLITQLIKEFGRIWKEEDCDVWVRYYRILVTGESTGLMETIVDAVSLHSLKKAAYAKISQSGQALPNYSIYDYYLEAFGKAGTSAFKKAQDKFMRSLVAYSIISYLLQIKDRHNGNILIDKEGHVIHIDFGFVLSNSPGSLGFEMAPFKLSQDYIELLGGLDEESGNNSKWAEFVALFKQAFKKVRKHAERIITIVELMQSDSKLPCFGHGESTVKTLRERFQLGLTSNQCDEFVEKLIVSSASSVFTKLYDSFQYYSQGVL